MHGEGKSKAISKLAGFLVPSSRSYIALAPGLIIAEWPQPSAQTVHHTKYRLVVSPSQDYYQIA